MAIFSLIKKEVEAKNSLEVKELLEEMQSMTAEEKRRITRKQSVPEEDDLTTDDRVEKVLDLFANESAVEKSKVAKIFKQKNNAVTLAIRKNPIKQKLLSMGVSKTKAKMDFPGPNFTCGGKYFTIDDSTTRIERGSMWIVSVQHCEAPRSPSSHTRESLGGTKVKTAWGPCHL